MITLKNAHLGEYCTMRVGGPADTVAFPETEEELVSLVALPGRKIVLGGGSNVIFPDSGYAGTVIFTTKLNSIGVNGTRVTAQAGAMLSALASAAADGSLAGLEFMFGIPGTVGGGVFMNAGAYGGQVSDRLESARVLSCADGSVSVLDAGSLGFAYRDSLLQHKELILLSAVFALEKGDRREIKAAMSGNMKKRREKQPLEYPSCGSVFKRPDGYFAGALIEECGLKGYTIGGACVSEKHAGFIVNRGGATASDVIALIAHVRDTVYEKKGVLLECEVKIIENG